MFLLFSYWVLEVNNWNRQIQSTHKQTAQPPEGEKHNTAPSQKKGTKGLVRSVQKPKKAKGLTVAKAAETAAELRDEVSISRVEQPVNVPLVVAPVDKVPPVQKCTSISQEIIRGGANSSVDRICKAKPSSNTDHFRSQARNCSLLDADLQSSKAISTDNVQNINGREESFVHNSSSL